MMIAIASFFTAVSGVVVLITTYHGQKDFEKALTNSLFDEASELTHKKKLDEIKKVVSFEGIYQLNK